MARLNFLNCLRQDRLILARENYSMFLERTITAEKSICYLSFGLYHQFYYEPEYSPDEWSSTGRYPTWPIARTFRSLCRKSNSSRRNWRNFIWRAESYWEGPRKIQHWFWVLEGTTKVSVWCFHISWPNYDVIIQRKRLSSSYNQVCECCLFQRIWGLSGQKTETRSAIGWKSRSEHKNDWPNYSCDARVFRQWYRMGRRSARKVESGLRKTGWHKLSNVLPSSTGSKYQTSRQESFFSLAFWRKVIE